MIVFWIERMGPRKRHGSELRSAAIVQSFDGSVTFHPPSSSGNCVSIRTNTTGRYRRTLRLCTIFDTSTQPPTLIREDFSLYDLGQLGAALPPIYISPVGDMVDLKTGKPIMIGPMTAGIHKAMDTAFAERNPELDAEHPFAPPF